MFSYLKGSDDEVESLYLAAKVRFFSSRCSRHTLPHSPTYRQQSIMICYQSSAEAPVHYIRVSALQLAS